MTNRQYKKYWMISACIVLTAIVAATYANAFQAVWVYDDFATIVNNANIRIANLNWEQISTSFHGKGHSINRPLGFFSFALNYYFHALDLFGYHLVNIIVHMINVVLVLLLMSRTLALVYPEEANSLWQRVAAFSAAALWATSPLHIMAVTDIWQRVTSLMALFYFSSFLCFIAARTAYNSGNGATLLRPGRKAVIYGFCSLLCFLLALATKENAALLPAALLAYELIVFQGGGTAVFKRSLKYLIPVSLLIIAIGCFYRDPSRLLNYNWRQFTLAERALTEPRIIIFYISQIFFPAPWRLNLLHHVPVSTSLLTPVTTLLSCGAIAVLISLAIAVSKRFKLFALAVLFFFINHLVESTIIPLELIYEHRNYVPAIFIYLLVSSIIARAISESNNRATVAAVGIMTCLAIFLQGYITHTRNNLFHDPVRLWTDNSAKAPGLSTVWMNLASAYSKQNLANPQLLLAFLNKAAAVDTFNNVDQKAITYMQICQIHYKNRKDPGQAAPYCEQSVAARARQNVSWYYLIEMAFLNKDYNEVRILIEKASEHNKDKYGELIFYRALSLLKDHATPDLIKKTVADAIKQAGPVKKIRLLEAETLRLSGNFENAIQIHKQLLTEHPALLPSVLSLVELYRATGADADLQQMIDYYQTRFNDRDYLTYYQQKEGLQAYQLSPAVKALLQQPYTAGN